MRLMEKYYFFDSNSAIGDRRLYSAADWSKVLSKFLENGIYVEGDNLSVTADGTAMAVTVGTGVSFIDGHMYENDAPLTLNVDAAEATLDRIDLVVLRLDITEQNRYIKAFVVKGEAAAAPIAPVPTDSTFIKEFPLAEIRITAGKSIVEQTQITDRRPADFVDPFVDGSRITALEAAVPQAETNAINFAKSFGLGSTVKNIGNTDLNNLDETGFYWGTNLANAPFGSGASYYIINLKIATSARVQLAFVSGSGVPFYLRRQTVGAWESWVQIETSSGTYAKMAEFGLGDIAADADWNTLLKSGFYRGNVNGPMANTNVWGFHSQHSTSAYATQFVARNGRSFFRTKENGIWGDWLELQNLPKTFVDAGRYASPQTISNNVNTKIAFDTETVDKDNEFASNRFTPKTAGLYEFKVRGSMDNVSPEISLYTNGTKKAIIINQDLDNKSYPRAFSGSLFRELAAGEYCDFYAYQFSGFSYALVEFQLQIIKVR